MSTFTEWTFALEQELSAPFPDDCVQQLSKGGSKIDFVSWHHYARRLNELVGPGWSMGAPITMEVGGKLLVGLPITILGTTRVNFGTEDEDKDDYGDAATNAWAQAFKRTLALFGMGLYMYDKKRRQQRRYEPRNVQGNGDVPLATAKQMELIERLERSHVFTDEDRATMKRAREKDPGRARAAAQIEWLQAEMAKRKAAEKEAAGV